MDIRTVARKARACAVFALAGYLVFAYPVLRLGTWLSGAVESAAIISTLCWAAGLGGMHYAFRGPNMRVRSIVVHWLGAGFLFAVLVLFAEGAGRALDIPDRRLAWSVLVAGMMLVVLAVALSYPIAVRRLGFGSRKVTRTWRIAQISDVHIGSRKEGFMRRIVDRLNRLDPDFVVVTGDLIDSSAVEIEDLQSLGDLSARTFFSLGNHERYADPDKIVDIAQRLGMTVLRQASETAGEIAFIGIDDAEHRDQVSRNLPSIPFDAHRFSVLLYHRPVGWEDAVEQGVDLMLSGHTHNGQIFPFNLIVKQQFPRIRGIHRTGDHRLYVSPGTGTWGPLMRLGSMNEISLFTIRPQH